MKKSRLLIIICTIIFISTSIFLVNSNQGYLRKLIYQKYILTTYHKLNDLKFSYKLTLSSKLSDYPKTKIFLSKKNYIKLNKEVNQTLSKAIKMGNLEKPDGIEYNARIINKFNKNSKSKVKLFGINADHFRDSNGHSLRVSYNGDENFGKRKENFLKPVSRTYGLDFIWNTIFYEISGGILIDLTPTRLMINNIDYGYYFKEPFFDKYLVELNGFRNGPIFELYKDSIKFNSNTDENLKFSSYLIDINDKKLLLEYIDYKMLYDIIAITILAGFDHSLYDINLHWYYNPVINKIQPILREVGNGNLIDLNYLDLGEIIQNHTKNNFLLSQLYIQKPLEIKKGVEHSLNEIKKLILKDKILEQEKIKTFLSFHPNINKFYEYWSHVKLNLKFIENIIVDTQENSEIDNLTQYNIAGTLILDQDLILSNKKINIAGGTKIIFRNNSNLIIDSSDLNIGDSINKVNILAENDSSSSIFISNSNVQINNTIFWGLSNLEKDNWILPSSVTFYESNVKILNSSFRNNKKGDDYINFFRSQNVEVISSIFENIYADAIDSDFSNIILVNSIFNNIGNDALDLSGSYGKVENNKFNYCQDKCLSIGEYSKVIAISNEFKNSEISIVVKDGSLVESIKSKFLNNKLNYVGFIKKPYYGSPIFNLLDEKNYLKILLDEEVDVKKSNFNKYNNIETQENVEDLLYGNLYGKKTK